MEIIPLLITFYLYESPKASFAACQKLGADSVACAVKKARSCDVHIPKPQQGYSQDVEMLAHELVHCYYGVTH